MRSGNLNLHSTTATVSVTVNVAQDTQVCFWWRGSSESCCDRFRFFIDGAQQLDVGGSYTTWAEACYPILAGTRVLRFDYSKDSSVNTGEDMFYVDDLRISSLFVEECDDGNNEPGDGCDPDCFLE
jgi:cysteine-rich repeat protein